jgi:uncharacterized coiled-coil DUF342 family protein
MIAMDWFRRLWEQLTRLSPASAQRRVDSVDRTLAELRAKVRALPPEQRAAFAQEIQAMIEQQAKAHQDLNDALDDRGDR